jgi:hypothetical protein
MAGTGGKRPGAGRKKGSTNQSSEKKRAFFAAILKASNPKKIWKRFLESADDRVALEATKYLHDQAYGRAPQSLEVGGPGGGSIKIEAVRIIGVDPPKIDE